MTPKLDIFRRYLTGAVVLLSGLLSYSSSFAGVILNVSDGHAVQIDAYEPIAQSFIAEDASVKIAFSLFDVNQFADPANSPLTMRLLAGSGTGGAQLGTVAQAITPNLGSIGVGVFVDFDFSFVDLIVGQQYTALIEAPTARWGMDIDRLGRYLGGVAFLNGVESTADLAFRISPTGQVSEPASIVIVGTALALFAVSRRRA